MTRLTGLDASFLYTETPTTPMHTLKIAVVGPSGLSADQTFAMLREEMGRRVHLMPAFVLRVLDIPLALHHPVWAHDPRLDIDTHLKRMTVAAPGGPVEMDAAVAEIAATPLDRSRPLWELWMLDGLAHGETAFVAKMHHAIADGCAAATMLVHLMAAVPVHPPMDAGLALPSRRRRVLEALSEQPRRWAATPSLLARTLRGIDKMVRYRRQESEVGTSVGAPRTPFNRHVSGSRSFATMELSLGEFKSLHRQLGVRMNDVLMAVVGRATASWLGDDNPDRAMVAAVPVGLPSGSGPRLLGNNLSNMLASMCTDVLDPVEQVYAVHNAMKDTKALHETFGPELMHEWADLAWPPVMTVGTRVYNRLKMADKHPPAANVIVSNVRGPVDPVCIAGTRIRRFYSVGPVLNGLGMNVTGWTYAGTLGLAVLADAEVVGNAHEMTAAIRRAYEDLLEASGRIPLAIRETA